MDGMLRTVNRILLALVGLLLLLSGLTLLAGGLGLVNRWNLPLPSWWRWSAPGDVVLAAADRTKWREQGWWWPVLLAVLAVVLLLALWWLLAQLRRRRIGDVLVDSGDGEGAQLQARAMERAVAAEAESYRGVERARVRLVGRRNRPRARVVLTLAADAEPGPALQRIREEALEHARASAGLGELPARIRFRSIRHGAERVS